MSTLHANGPEEVPGRIEALAALAGMPRAAVHAQLRGALRAVVHMGRADGLRRVEAIGVVVADPEERGAVRVVRALTTMRDGLRPGAGLDQLIELAPALGARGRVDAC